MLNLTNTDSAYLHKESKTESFPKHQSLVISEHSLVKGTPQAIREWLMSLPQDSHANHLVQQESSLDMMTRGTCGLQPLNAFALYDQNTHYWKTCQVSLLAGISEPFLETWPKAGTLQNGAVFRLNHLVGQLIENDFSLPAPTKSMGKRGWGISQTGRKRYSEKTQNNAMAYGYKPHPQILEWAMGWPITMTELAPLATGKFQQWLNLHGKF